jgi:hypothetical protein
VDLLAGNGNPRVLLLLMLLSLVSCVKVFPLCSFLRVLLHHPIITTSELQYFGLFKLDNATFNLPTGLYLGIKICFSVGK